MLGDTNMYKKIYFIVHRRIVFMELSISEVDNWNTHKCNYINRNSRRHVPNNGYNV